MLVYDSFEEALYLFGTRCEILIALERGGKMSQEDAYQQVKKELAALKKLRKELKKRNESDL